MDSGETNEKSLFSHVTYNGPMNNLVVPLKTSVLSFRETEMDQSESSFTQPVCNLSKEFPDLRWNKKAPFFYFKLINFSIQLEIPNIFY